LGKKVEEICKWKRDDYPKRLEELRQIVADPQFVCVKCGRVANKKKWLCKPVKLGD
jgi:hypothetical protein